MNGRFFIKKIRFNMLIKTLIFNLNIDWNQEIYNFILKVNY